MTALPVFALTACSSRRSITIALGGDVMLARFGLPMFTKEPILGDSTQLFRSADLSMANLESPLTDLNSSITSIAAYNLCARSNTLDLLKGSGITLFSLVNNHSDDCMPNGDLFTSKMLQSIGLDGVDDEGKYLEIKRAKIAVFAAEDVTKSIDLTNLITKVEKAKSDGYFVIVSLHWGNEYQAGPDIHQEDFAQTLASAGVDVIWGHHPHVLQRMEWLQGNRDHSTLVIYSLGNLISDQTMLEDAQRTAIIQLIITKGKITAIQVTPLKMDVASKELIPAADRDATIILDRLRFDEVESVLER